MCGIVGVVRRRAQRPAADLRTLVDELERARHVLPDSGGLTTGAAASDTGLEAFWSIRVALAGLDRLEVRGRDSAGIHVLVRGHHLERSDSVARLVDQRSRDRLFSSGAVRSPDGLLAFVYKAAAEIGELGDNTAVLRRAIQDDPLLHMAVQHEDAEAVVLGHTRWA